MIYKSKTIHSSASASMDLFTSGNVKAALHKVHHLINSTITSCVSSQTSLWLLFDFFCKMQNTTFKSQEDGWLSVW